jgi:DNA repair exonuclease SbcCD nuclease subunit
VKWLITTDTHLSDKARDEYRFGLFKWLKKQHAKYHVDVIFILGDITENKDRHSSKLVNRIVDELHQLPPPIMIPRGNHDGIDPTNPFFNFLNRIDGLRFIIDPYFDAQTGTAFIPHCRDQVSFDAACAQMPQKPDAVMLHQTFNGARAETGTALTGLSAAPVSALKARLGVYSGDVHVPQSHDKVTYVGAPYHVRFGDNFEPRVLLIDNGKETDLHFDCPRKYSLTITDADDIINHPKLKANDQIKLTVNIAREEAVEWQAIRKRILDVCREGDLDVFGIDCNIKTTKQRERIALEPSRSNRDVLKAFCDNEGVASNIRKIGADLL